MTGSMMGEPCPLGTYGNSSGLRQDSDCTPCPGGYYCDGLGRTEPTDVCDAGFYCKEKAFTSAPADGVTGGLCPAGGYCVAGSATPVPCDPGFYINFAGAKTHHQCIACPPGFYCAGSNNANASQECAAGYYCTGGSAVPTQHETQAGYYTEAGAFKMEPCPFGSYQPAKLSERCLDCPQGKFCNETAITEPYICPPGYYCPLNSKYPTPCPEGTYNGGTGADRVEQCVNCDPGKACESVGLPSPNIDCDPGHYCSIGAAVRNPIGETYGDLCPGGYYCPLGTNDFSDHPCPNGTYSNYTGNQAEENCTSCDPGKVCNGFGLTEPNDICAAGYFCRGGASSDSPRDGGTTGDLCPTGHYCPAGTGKILLHCSPAFFLL